MRVARPRLRRRPAAPHFGLLCLLALLAGPATAAPLLERVVMVSRHGVRAPIKTVQALEALTGRTWPAWPVAAGEMTQHGAASLRQMADALRRTYAAKGLLPASGCPAAGTIAVWSDAKDRRTRQSGDIIAERLAPGCGVEAGHDAPDAHDPLFDSSGSKACPIGLLSRAGALLDAVRGSDADVLTPADRAALARLQDILAPGACQRPLGVCLVPGADAGTAKISADIALGATIAEALYLEYEQGFPAAEVGWGKAGTPEAIDAVMPIHEHGIDILRRTPEMAARRGTVLARTILAVLDGGPLPPEAPKLDRDAKVLMFAGHDSNLLYLAGIMGLDWRLPDQPSVTAPDTTLAFELWRDPATGIRTVKVVVYAQTLAQLRGATALDGAERPDVVAVEPDLCRKSAAAACELARLRDAVERRLAKLCGT